MGPLKMDPFILMHTLITLGKESTSIDQSATIQTFSCPSASRYRTMTRYSSERQQVRRNPSENEILESL